MSNCSKTAFDVFKENEQGCGSMLYYGNTMLDSLFHFKDITTNDVKELEQLLSTFENENHDSIRNSKYIARLLINEFHKNNNTFLFKKYIQIHPIYVNLKEVFDVVNYVFQNSESFIVSAYCLYLTVSIESLYKETDRKYIETGMSYSSFSAFMENHLNKYLNKQLKEHKLNYDKDSISLIHYIAQSSDITKVENIEIDADLSQCNSFDEYYKLIDSNCQQQRNIFMKGIDDFNFDGSFKSAVKLMSIIAPKWDSLLASSKLISNNNKRKLPSKNRTFSDSKLFSIYSGDYNCVSETPFNNKINLESSLISDFQSFERLNKNKQNSVLNFLEEYRSDFNSVLEKCTSTIVNDMIKNWSNYSKVLKNIGEDELPTEFRNHIVKFVENMRNEFKRQSVQSHSDGINFIVHTYLPAVSQFNNKIFNKYNNCKKLLNNDALLLFNVEMVKPTLSQLSQLQQSQYLPELPKRPRYNYGFSQNNQLRGGDSPQDYNFRPKTDLLNSFITAQSEFNRNYERLYRELINELRDVNIDNVKLVESDSILLACDSLTKIIIKNPKTTVYISGFYGARNYNKLYSDSLEQCVKTISSVPAFNRVKVVIEKMYRLVKDSAEKSNKLIIDYIQHYKKQSELYGIIMNKLRIPCKLNSNDFKAINEALKIIISKIKTKSAKEFSKDFKFSIKNLNELSKNKENVIKEYFENEKLKLKIKDFDNPTKREQKLALQLNTSLLDQKCNLLIYFLNLDLKIRNIISKISTTDITFEQIRKIEKAYMGFNNTFVVKDADKLIEELNKYATSNNIINMFKYIKCLRKFIMKGKYVNYIKQLFVELKIENDINWDELDYNIAQYIAIDSVSIENIINVTYHNFEKDVDEHCNIPISKFKLFIANYFENNKYDSDNCVVKNKYVFKNIILELLNSDVFIDSFKMRTSDANLFNLLENNFNKYFLPNANLDTNSNSFTKSDENKISYTNKYDDKDISMDDLGMKYIQNIINVSDIQFGNIPRNEENLEENNICLDFIINYDDGDHQNNCIVIATPINNNDYNLNYNNACYEYVNGNLNLLFAGIIYQLSDMIFNNDSEKIKEKFDLTNETLVNDILPIIIIKSVILSTYVIKSACIKGEKFMFSSNIVQNISENITNISSALPIYVFETLLLSIIKVLENNWIVKYEGSLSVPLTNLTGGSMFDNKILSTPVKTELIIDAVPFYLSGLATLEYFITQYSNKNDNEFSTQIKIPKISVIYPIYKLFKKYNVRLGSITEQQLTIAIDCFNKYWMLATGSSSEKLTKCVDFLFDELSGSLLFGDKITRNYIKNSGDSSPTISIFESMQSSLNLITESIKNTTYEAFSKYLTYDGIMNKQHRMSAYENKMKNAINKIKSCDPSQRVLKLKSLLINKDNDIGKYYYMFMDTIIVPIYIIEKAYDNILNSFAIENIENYMEKTYKYIDEKGNEQSILIKDLIENVKNGKAEYKYILFNNPIVNAYNLKLLKNSLDEFKRTGSYTLPNFWLAMDESTYPSDTKINMSPASQFIISQIVPIENMNKLSDAYNYVLSQMQSDLMQILKNFTIFPFIPDEVIYSIQSNVESISRLKFSKENNYLTNNVTDEHDKQSLNDVNNYVFKKLNYEPNPPNIDRNITFNSISDSTTLIYGISISENGNIIIGNGNMRAMIDTMYSNAKDVVQYTSCKWKWYDWVICMLSFIDEIDHTIPSKLMDDILADSILSKLVHKLNYINGKNIYYRNQDGVFDCFITQNIVGRSLLSINIKELSQLSKQLICAYLTEIPSIINILRSVKSVTSKELISENINFHSIITSLIKVLINFYNKLIPLSTPNYFMSTDLTDAPHSMVELYDFVMNKKTYNLQYSDYIRLNWSCSRAFSNLDLTFPKFKEVNEFNWYKKFIPELFANEHYANGFENTMSILSRVTWQAMSANNLNVINGNNKVYECFVDYIPKIINYMSECDPVIIQKFIDNSIRAIKNYIITNKGHHVYELTGGGNENNYLINNAEANKIFAILINEIAELSNDDIIKQISNKKISLEMLKLFMKEFDPFKQSKFIENDDTELSDNPNIEQIYKIIRKNKDITIGEIRTLIKFINYNYEHNKLINDGIVIEYNGFGNMRNTINAEVIDRVEKSIKCHVYGIEDSIQKENEILEYDEEEQVDEQEPQQPQEQEQQEQQEQQPQEQQPQEQQPQVEEQQARTTTTSRRTTRTTTTSRRTTRTTTTSRRTTRTSRRKYG